MSEPTDASSGCPFCGSLRSSPFGRRRGGEFRRCRSCRSIHRPMSDEAYGRLHDDAFEHDDFLDRIVAARGAIPATDVWDRLQLPGTTVLEIGPGAGHLLAGAAQRHRTVTAVETSARHRAFIRSTWGIDAVFPSMDELPDGLQFDAVVAINVLEHVRHVDAFLDQICRRLRPGGVLFVSTPNAEALVCSVARTMWSMFKEPDHVSFPSRAGVRAAAVRAGLDVEALWSDEMAFETPVGLVVAARDLWRERTRPEGVLVPAGGSGTAPVGGRGTRAMASISARRWARFEPSSRIAGGLGRAGTVKARLRPAGAGQPAS